MRKIILFVLALSCMWLIGCTSKYITPVDPLTQQTQPAEDESVIVFYRDSSFGGAIQATLAEDVDGDLKFVGIVSQWTRFEHKTTPGQHTYLVTCFAGYSQLMDATLEGGKTYYCRLPMSMGFFSGSFQFEPVTKAALAEGKATRDLTKCTLMQSTPEAISWFQGSLGSLKGEYAAALKEPRIVLRSEDGTVVPVR